MGKNRDFSKFPNAIIVLDNGNVGIGTTTFSEGTQPAGTLSFIPNSSVSSGPLLQLAGNGRIRPASSGDRLSIDGNALYLNSSIGGNIITNTAGGNFGINNSSPSYKLTIGTITGGGTATASPTCITMDETFGNNGLGSNFKLRLFQNNATNTYGLGVSDSLLEVVAGATGSIGFFSNQSQLSMKINSAGQITKPYQPCFYAYGPTGGYATSGTGAFTSLNQTRINRGSHYNTSTGRFTAPVAGAYEFIFSLLWRQTSDSGAGEISIGVNGSNINGRGMAYTSVPGNSGFHDQTFVRVILNLAAGDYVTGWIHSSGNGGGGNWYYGDGLAHFSGMLLG